MDLRNPTFGNRFIVNQNSSIRKSMDGDTLIVNANFPVFQGFDVSIEGLTLDQRDQIIAYFKGTAGQEIKFIDHENVTWKGFVLSNPEITSRHDFCDYFLTFAFDGIPQ